MLKFIKKSNNILKIQIFLITKKIRFNNNLMMINFKKKLNSMMIFNNSEYYLKH